LERLIKRLVKVDIIERTFALFYELLDIFAWCLSFLFIHLLRSIIARIKTGVCLPVGFCLVCCQVVSLFASSLRALREDGIVNILMLIICHDCILCVLFQLNTWTSTW